MIHSASLQPLEDLANKIKNCAVESDWLRSKAIAENLLIGGLFCVFIQNLNTIIVTIFYVINE